MSKYFFFVFFIFVNFIFAQNQTVGLFQYDEESFEGYTLFSPNQNTYLIDNCGKEINMWTSSYVSGSSVYLLDDGTLLRACRIQSLVFSGGGSGGRVEKRDWDNNLLWSYDFSSNAYHQHHDIAPMPNGNILVLNWEYKSRSQSIEAGRDSLALPDDELWPTYIMEIEPQGTNDMNIVWEWHLWDHLIQDFDSSKTNYGIVEDHPELLDINFYSANGKNDWLHCNSIDYNEDLDQIVISSRALSELYIIDHSTTTLEAASHNGGQYGKGGDFLYRWGNPQSYNDNFSVNDKKLFGQHDVHWIPYNYPDGGKIMLFNNGQTRGYSSVDIITPPQINPGFYYLNSNNIFGPDSTEWSYVDDIPTSFYASYISGAERLPNGNTLICEGTKGHFFEINSQNDIVWNYFNPVVNSGPLSQGVPIPIGSNSWGNSTFRCERYALDFSGFDGKDLTPKHPIELNPFPDTCSVISSIHELVNTKELVKIVNIVGQEVFPTKNQVLFYIYSDGSVKKQMILN